MPPVVHGQYFGRNKVLWEQLDFEVLETEHFEIYHYPPDAAYAEYVARLAERWYARLSAFFDHELQDRKPLIIYQDHADFQQTLTTPGLIGQGIGGFTESALDRIVLPLTGINADNNHVLGHELVHAFQFDIAERIAELPNDRIQPERLPAWMTEGLAEYLSQGRYDPTTAMWMRDAVLYETLPDTGGLFRRLPSPYQYGQALWAYIASRWGDDAVRRLFVSATALGFEKGLDAALGTTEDELIQGFHATLREYYVPLLEGRVAAEDIASPLLTRATTGASVNVAPALSPDGRWIAFLSTRELSLELYLADTGTGEIRRKLLSSETNPHYANLSFLDASVAWSPDGSRVAFGVFAEGERRIVIYDIEGDRIVRRIDLPGIKGMRHAAWSPDGRRIVFSAIVGGASDLYMLDLETDELTRLTDDAYTAIQPAFSPDGSRIVFVTDRGPQTNLELLAFGPLQLALLDLETGDVEVLRIFAEGKHIDPSFSAEGESIYFIGTPAGVPDIYRYGLDDGRIEQLTALKIGASGITGKSPALSVAADGTIAFSVLHDGDWNIYSLETATSETVAAAPESEAAGLLPPIPAEDAFTLVDDYLGRPRPGLPSLGRHYPEHDYRSDLRLASIGPATIGVGTSVAGSDVGFGGAVSFYFTDLLNRHQVGLTLQGGSGGGVLDFADTIGADLTYLNQTHRFQWGARATRVPYVSSVAFSSVGTVEIDGEVMPAEVIERQVSAVQVSDLSLLGQYPFSVNDRVEASIGVSYIDFERELERLVFPEAAPPFREQVGLPSPEALNLRQASIAYVHDTSRFGFIDPVRGTRWRVETGWTSGDVSFGTARIDYRRYFFYRPVTFAVRLVGLGRFGDGAEDSRLPPLDIGNNSLVHGYDLGSFALSECTPTPAGGCPEFERLIGSRIAVMNLELRVPLFGTEDFGLYELPLLATEAVIFADAGAAWSAGESVTLTFERDTADRVPVFSAGLALRSVLGGALPVEVFYAYPFQRPEENAVFGFRISVGW